jgi:hypothetical protein
MDICLEILAFAPVELPVDVQGHWFEQGDIICAYPAAQMGAKSGNAYIPKNSNFLNRTRYLFVTGIPDSFQGQAITIEKINAVLTEFQRIVAAIDPEMEKPRVWNIWGDLSQGMKNALSDGYDTVSLAQLKSIVKRKDTNAYLSELDFINL